MFFQEIKEQLAIWAEEKLTQEYPKKTLWLIFGVASLGNILSYIVPLVLPAFLAEPTGTAINIEGRIGIYLLLVPFLCGALMVHSLIRIFFPDERSHLEMIAAFYSYSEKLVKDRKRAVLLISLGAGGANCIILFFTVIWGRMALYP